MTDEEIRTKFKEMFPEEANNEKFLKDAAHMFKHIKKLEKKHGPLTKEKIQKGLKLLRKELFDRLKDLTGRTYH
tara:strand:- start:505 stop:726 length:222 start_codon:yes stop_codon:yes gene_type:complete